MSYILDALKRSDRERRQGNIPDLESVHVSPVSAEPGRWSNSSLVLLAVLLGNVIFAGLWAYETMTGDDDEPQYRPGSPQVNIPVQPMPAMPAPSAPDVRFGQPLPKPQPTDLHQLQAGDGGVVADELAAYLARQGVVSEPEPVARDNEYPQGVEQVVPVEELPEASLPQAKTRLVPRKLEDLSPNNDPYASLFEKPQTPAAPPEPAVAPKTPTVTAPREPETPPVLEVSEAQLLPGEEIIRPSSGTAPAVPPAEPAYEPPVQADPEPVIAAQTIEPRQPSAAPRSRVNGPVSWDTVPLITDLPEVVQAELPPLDFNSHMFSSDPRFRTVIINGKSLRERDYLDNRTRLMLITELGVVLQFDEVRFKVAVLEAWEE